MRLVENWKYIVMNAHSMWAVYLAFLLFGASEFLVWWTGRQVLDPYFVGYGCTGLLLYGAVGRIIDQEQHVQKNWFVRHKGIIVAVVLMLTGSAAFSMSDQRVTDPPGETRAHSGAGAAETAVEPVPGRESAGSDAFLTLCVPFIGKWEGLRLNAYLDIVGVPTVCYGETKGVKMGDSYTKAECDAMLAREVIEYRDGLHRYFTPATLTSRLPVARDCAFTSLGYNVGVAGAGKSTATRRLNAGDVPGACTALTWWNKAGGRVVRGLVRRRADEQALCLQGAS